MEAILPAAGKGTRLEPLTDNKPKALVEVAGKPLIEHSLEQASALGCDAATVVVGHLGSMIRDHLKQSHIGVEITYAEQPDQVGLADAVARGGPVDDEALVLLPDNIFIGDMSSLVDHGGVLVERVPPEHASRYGVVEADAGVLERVTEKPDDPPTNTVCAGAYVLPPRVVELCGEVGTSARGETELSDALTLAADKGAELAVHEFHGKRVDVGYPEDVRAAEEALTGTA